MAKIFSKKWFDSLSPSHLRIGMNLWSPFLGSGIKVTSISPDFRTCIVVLKPHWYNKNYVGTHFGGGMFAMADPFYMLILLKNLGGDYIVWDKAAAIKFIRPARGTLHATFTFSEEEIQDIIHNANNNEKYIFDKQVAIFNEQNDEVALVTKTMYVKRKSQ